MEGRQPVKPADGGGKEAAEECAWKTAETWSRPRAQMGWAVTMTARRPRTMEATRDGGVPEYKARVIAARTAELSETARRQVTRLD